MNLTEVNKDRHRPNQTNLILSALIDLVVMADKQRPKEGGHLNHLGGLIDLGHHWLFHKIK